MAVHFRSCGEGTWRVESVPHWLVVPATFQAVSCVTSGFCSAVGYSSGRVVVPRLVMERLCMIEAPTSDPLGSGYSVLQSIACIAIQLCTAVGRWCSLDRAAKPLRRHRRNAAEKIAGQVLAGSDQLLGWQLELGATNWCRARRRSRRTQHAMFGAAGGTILIDPSSAWPQARMERGYWLVAADGGIFTFGDAPFYGSTGFAPSNQPVVGMASFWMDVAIGSWQPTAGSSPSATPGSMAPPVRSI